ncbi:MAG: cobalt ECF transporter T component CbiQ [Bacillota bacterium]|jgi:cobalt/nickel transport system permease protein
MSKIVDAIQTLSSLEELAAADSALHRAHPGVKIAVTFIYLICVLSIQRHQLSPLIPLFFYPAVMIPAADIPFAAIFKRTAVALPFSLFAGISNIVFERDIALYLFHIPVTYGIISFTTLMIKTFLCVSAVLILIATTPSFALFSQLRRFHIPQLLVMTVMLTYRYIFLLLDEAANMTLAYHLRAPNQKGVQMKDMGSFLGQLILRCFDRSERVYAAMECRGFDGEYRAGGQRKTDGASLAAGAAVIAVVLALRFFSLPRLIETIF